MSTTTSQPLENAWAQWQTGDRQSLAQHDPERAKLALLGAAGRLQAGYWIGIH